MSSHRYYWTQNRIFDYLKNNYRKCQGISGVMSFSFSAILAKSMSETVVFKNASPSQCSLFFHKHCKVLSAPNTNMLCLVLGLLYSHLLQNCWNFSIAKVREVIGIFFVFHTFLYFQINLHLQSPY